MPGFRNPDPILDQKKFHFPHPFSDLASKIHARFQTSQAEIIERQQKGFLNSIGNSQITLQFRIHLELKRQIRTYTPFSFLENIPDFGPKWAKSIPVFRPKRPKPYLFLLKYVGGGTYLYGLYKRVTPPGRFCYLIFGSLCYLKRKLLGSIYHRLLPEKWSCSCSINSKCYTIICKRRGLFSLFQFYAERSYP